MDLKIGDMGIDDIICFFKNYSGKIETFILWIFQFDKRSIMDFIIFYSNPNILRDFQSKVDHSDCEICEQPYSTFVGQCIADAYHENKGDIKELFLKVLYEVSIEDNEIYSITIEKQKMLQNPLIQNFLRKSFFMEKPRKTSSLGQFMRSRDSTNLNIADFLLLININKIITFRQIEALLPEPFRSVDRGNMDYCSSFSHLLISILKFHKYELIYPPEIYSHCSFKLPQCHLIYEDDLPALSNNSISIIKFKYIEGTSILYSRGKGVISSHDANGMLVHSMTIRPMDIPKYCTCSCLITKNKTYLTDLFIYDGKVLAKLSYLDRLEIAKRANLEILPAADPLDIKVFGRFNSINFPKAYFEIRNIQQEINYVCPPFSGYRMIAIGEEISGKNLYLNSNFAKFIQTFILLENYILCHWSCSKSRIEARFKLCYDIEISFDHIDEITLPEGRFKYSIVDIYSNDLELTELIAIKKSSKTILDIVMN